MGTWVVVVVVVVVDVVLGGFVVEVDLGEVVVVVDSGVVVLVEGDGVNVGVLVLVEVLELAELPEFEPLATGFGATPAEAPFVSEEPDCRELRLSGATELERKVISAIPPMSVEVMTKGDLLIAFPNM